MNLTYQISTIGMKWTENLTRFMAIGVQLYNQLLNQRKKQKKQLLERRTSRKASLAFAQVLKIVSRVGFNNNLHYYNEQLDLCENYIQSFKKMYPAALEESKILDEALYNKRITVKGKRI